MPDKAAAANPLVAGLERLPVHPTTLVIFGATGDLCHRKLLPAIYNLAHEGQLPERFNLIATSRQELTDDEFRADLTKSVKEFSRREPDDKVLEAMIKNVRYVSGNFDDPQVYAKIDKALKGFDEEAGQTLNRCFYLSTAPMFFPVIVGQLGDAKLVRDPHAEIRIVIEKPFGTTLAEAKALNKEVLSVFKENQVYRIDHYLGKETVQNVLAFRFANSLFEPIWNRNAIDSVQITASEDLGIGTRAGYYDGAGALRDLVQNHMMQLLTLIAMEPPVHFNADEIRDEKVKVLRSIHTPDKATISKLAVHARYTKGTVGGEDVPGYLQEKDVPKNSKTETFAALRLEVDNWRWAGVPFYLRTGKRLARKVTEIAITLKPVPHLAFIQDGTVGVRPNQLVLTLQPNEGVSLSLGAKIPGTRMGIRPVNMEFLYGTAFMSQSPEAYERLILDAMRGDATLFTRNDEVEQQWRIIDPIIASWARTRSELPEYEAGSQGPEETEKILLPGHSWRAI
jgi:glucose-6-phosphate 1-dehydrogenase